MNPFRFLGLGRVERKAGPVLFGEDAVTFFFVTGPVVGGTAFRANDNVVSFVQRLMTTAAMAVLIVNHVKADPPQDTVIHTIPHQEQK